MLQTKVAVEQTVVIRRLAFTQWRGHAVPMSDLDDPEKVHIVSHIHLLMAWQLHGVWGHCFAWQALVKQGRMQCVLAL